MPNHVTSQVTMTKVNSKQLEEVKRFITGLEKFYNNKREVETERPNLFDFNKVIPMPEELQGTTSPSPTPRPDLVKKFGVDNWYDWCLKNWGTKWNTYNHTSLPNGWVFDTAWSTPTPVFFALSEKFPSVRFTIQFADEDIGSNCGTLIFEKGLLVSEVYPEGEEAKQFACEIKGLDYPQT